MKLDIFDSYNIRARLSPSIILLGPIALTIFICFEGLYNSESSVVLMAILLAMTNYIPLLQRRLSKRNSLADNFAAKLLYFDNTEIDKISKRRYLKKLASIDDSFSSLLKPSNSSEYKECCESAVSYLRNNTRDNHLVLEENINYGFCKNMMIDKPIGIAINISLAVFAFIYSLLSSEKIREIPSRYWLSITINFLFIAFWVFGVNKKTLEESAKRYARTLIDAIDSLDNDKEKKLPCVKEE